MISDSDALKLSAAITELTGQEFSDAGARLFVASLNPMMTLNDVLRMLAKWNTMSHSWHRVEPGDLNELWRQSRPSSQVSEARIGELLAEGTAGMNGAQYVLARRTLLREINKGTPEALAASIALDAAERLQIEPPKQKTNHRVVHHFIGTLGDGPVTNIIGK